MPNVISERALFARVARKLAHDGLFLHRARYDSRLHQNLDRYYCTDDRGCVSGYLFTNPKRLLSYGRELGVVAENEHLDESQ